MRHGPMAMGQQGIDHYVAQGVHAAQVNPFALEIFRRGPFFSQDPHEQGDFHEVGARSHRAVNQGTLSR
jgi:hypothetical protein